MLSGLQRYRGLGMIGIWRLLHRQVSEPPSTLTEI
jgi:hypothetical protein